MKKMKRMAAAIALLLIATVFLGACGSKEKYADSKYLGDWAGTTASYLGVEVDVPTIIGGDFILTLNADGSCIVDVAGEENSGYWDETETGVEISDDSDETLDLEAQEDGTLALDYSGVSLIFEQQ